MSDAHCTTQHQGGCCRCCDSLRQLKAIPTTYRMTSKPMPFRPSPYAGALLKPLHAFLEAPASQALRKSARSSVAQVRAQMPLCAETC